MDFPGPRSVKPGRHEAKRTITAGATPLVGFAFNRGFSTTSRCLWGLPTRNGQREGCLRIAHRYLRLFEISALRAWPAALSRRRHQQRPDSRLRRNFSRNDLNYCDVSTFAAPDFLAPMQSMCAWRRSMRIEGCSAEALTSVAPLSSPFTTSRATAFDPLRSVWQQVGFGRPERGPVMIYGRSAATNPRVASWPRSVSADSPRLSNAARSICRDCSM